MGGMSMPRRGGRAVRGSAAALTVAVAALITVTACTSPASTAAAPPSSGRATPSGPATGSAQAAGPIVPTASTLRWHSCAGLIARIGIRDCTMLSVPLNYADPGGRHISLALDMIPATAPVSQQQGILLVNPGGPGGSGLSLAAVVAEGLSPSVARDYDIIGFDPRGVGSSVPQLSCDPSFFAGPRPNYIPASAAAEQVLINRAKTYANDCEQKFGWLLPYMTTENVARDLDSIRAAFGVAKINYFAFSWGTYLGQVYATLFPQRVRRMVLDSTVDPTGVWYTDNIDQDYAFQGRMNAFYAWVAQYDSTYNVGSTAAQVQAAWYRAHNQLLAHPANGVIGPDEFDDTYLLGGYDDQFWPGLAQALSSYLNSGSATDLIGQYQVLRRPERERVRGLQRRGVRRHQLAAQLRLLDLRHRAGLPERAVLGLGQRLVQRRVRVLASPRGGRAAADQRRGPARHPHAAGNAGPGHPVCGRPGRAQAAAVGPDGSGGRGRQPRAVVLPAAGQLRSGLPEQLPRHRNPAAGEQVWSTPPARPCRIRRRS